ncbi:MAG: FAD-dependent oxidoreductase [Candidatus Peregrinibacteria bacterium]|nr:FAD-dependent oxidoreductase [Candidatus Peregrinibacteria bacterium]
MTSTRSPWKDSVRVPSYAPLSKNTSADVCVIGAGIAGLTTAYLLAKSGKKVIVLESKEIGCGESGRTTAHLTAALDDRYSRLEKVHGRNGARLAAESHTKAIDRIEEICAEEKIECAFRRVNGYLFLTPGDPSTTLEREATACHRAGLKDVSFVERAPLPSFDTGRALLFPRQAEFHILAYLAGLARAIVARGGTIHSETHVTNVEREKILTIQTEAGHTVITQHVVIATNAPIGDNVQVYGKQAPYRTFVLAFAIARGAIEHGLYWDTNEQHSAQPYHYIRFADHTDTEELLIVGGEDHKTGQANDAELRFHRLEEWTRKRFAQAGDIQYRWSGQVMETMDGLAMIGQMPGTRGSIVIATGDSGNGMTHGTIAGMLITDLLNGVENPWAKLYSPSRFRGRSLPTFLSENTNVAKELLMGWVEPGVQDIGNDAGGIVHEGVKRIALYRDSQGTEHRMSAVCPHKGCIVQWNGLEKSWDCPCHGSRYDRFGTVLNGPSSANLKPVENAKQASGKER